MICYAIIGRNAHKERIMTVNVTCTFISPMLEFTSQEVIFSIQQPPGSKLIYHTKQLGVRNVSKLSVTAMLSCSYPFCLMKEEIALAFMVSVGGRCGVCGKGSV